MHEGNDHAERFIFHERTKRIIQCARDKKTTSPHLQDDFPRDISFLDKPLRYYDRVCLDEKARNSVNSASHVTFHSSPRPMHLLVHPLIILEILGKWLSSTKRNYSTNLT